MRILILEDHPSILLVLQQIIKGEINPTIEIISFNDSDSAINFLKSNKTDAVISDIQINNTKQIDIIRECNIQKIPCMVFSSHINPTIIQHCESFNTNVIVSKSSTVEELKLGIRKLLAKEIYRCSLSNQVSQRKSRISEFTPKVDFSAAEEFVILAQIEGKSTIELSKETRKSKYTIRNQRMSLIEKNGCTMEEIVRRYLFWHTNG